LKPAPLPETAHSDSPGTVREPRSHIDTTDAPSILFVGEDSAHAERLQMAFHRLEANASHAQGAIMVSILRHVQPQAAPAGRAGRRESLLV